MLYAQRFFFTLPFSLFTQRSYLKSHISNLYAQRSTLYAQRSYLYAHYSTLSIQKCDPKEKYFTNFVKRGEK